MSRKRVLNLVSRKKRNGMLSWSNTLPTGASRTPAIGPAYINGASNGIFVWSPTMQSLVTGSVSNEFIDSSDRTSTTCYMRGLSETIRYQTSSPLPWFWRRICFTMKAVLAPASTAPINTERPYVDTSNGIERFWLNLQVNDSNTYLTNVYALIFKGAVNQDWTDPIIAPLDSSRITVKYDRTITLKSGNSVGTVGEKKFWHGMNKNLVYDDDEQGSSTSTSYQSVTSKAGMGDYYIIDIFAAGAGGGSGDILRIDANSTLYWHEK